MKRNLLLTPLFIFIVLQLFAQNFDYEVSKPYKVIDASTKDYFYKDDKILAVKFEKKLTAIQTWDANSMKELSRKEYKDFPNGFVLESLQEINKKYYLFYSLWDKSKKTEQLFVRTIDFEEGKFTGKGKLIFKLKGKVTHGGSGLFGREMERKGYSDKFLVEKSFDETRVLIHYRRKPENKNDDINYDKIGFNVYTDDLEEVSREEIKMPYTEAKMNNLDYSVDSKGNVYVLALIYKDDTQNLNKGGYINYRFEVLRINANSREINKTKVKNEQLNFYNLSLFNQANDQMVCAGFFSKNKNSNNADGLVVFKVDENGVLTEPKTYEIPFEILERHLSKKTKKKNKKKEKEAENSGYRGLRMRKIIVDEDGSLMMLGEQFYVLSHTSFSDGKARTYYSYHYNYILAVKIDKNGEMAWINDLPKIQVSRAGRGGMSFEYFYNNENHYCLFLDNINNLKLKLEDNTYEAHRDGAGGFFTAYKINHKSGEVEKVSLFDTRDVKGIDVFQFQVDRIVQISPTEFVVEVYKKKKEDILIKVKVKE